MSRPDLSVIITAHNRAAMLPVLLAGFERQHHASARFEVLIVDNGGTDGLISQAECYARGAPIRIRAVDGGEEGETAAKNTGARAAEGHWLLFFSPDLLPGTRLIERHIFTHNRTDRHACVFGRILPHPRLRHGALTRWFLPENRFEPMGGVVRLFDWNSCNLSLPRAAFDELGGFDPALPPGVADLDLGRRMRALELVCMLDDGARAYAWCAAELEDERRRHYLEGRALHGFIARTGENTLRAHFHLSPSWWLRLRDRAFIPYFVRACQDREQEDIRLLGTTYRRILRHERWKGHEDARRDRAPAWEARPDHTATPALDGGPAMDLP
ncbi:MAG: glycosyltransferase family 2 protein [Candidatus Hydrogenedentes bacterium]|nr:glycosyltransferase family 2 protein [Candidatus Hydrogenedentota bacterium]